MSGETNDGGSAFPTGMTGKVVFGGGRYEGAHVPDYDSKQSGMSLRDWFAGKAPVDWSMAQQAAQLSGTVRAIDRPKMWAAMAVLRYEFADAMLAER